MAHKPGKALALASAPSPLRTTVTVRQRRSTAAPSSSLRLPKFQHAAPASIHSSHLPISSTATPPGSCAVDVPSLENCSSGRSAVTSGRRQFLLTTGLSVVSATLLSGLSAPASSAVGGSEVAAAQEAAVRELAGAFAIVSPSPLPAAALLSGAGGGSDGPPSSPSAGSPPAGLDVTPRQFTSLAEAVAACPNGGTVLVAAGRYTERLVLERPVTVRAWPKGASVQLVWQTPEPYQSTIVLDTRRGSSSGEEVLLEGLTVRHSSKSVANNYGVYIKSGSPSLVDCDVSSASGAGIGVEGASPRLLGCRIHDCARQGLAIFGATASLDLMDLDASLATDPGLLYGMSGGVVQGCDVSSNALDGVLVRSGASPDLLGNLIHNNGGVGVNLQDCAGRYERNTVYDNVRGAVSVSALFELDTGDLAGSNSLRGLLRRV